MQAGPTSHIWHHNPKAIASSERAMCSQYIRMINQAHCLYLPPNTILYQLDLDGKMFNMMPIQYFVFNSQCDLVMHNLETTINDT